MKTRSLIFFLLLFFAVAANASAEPQEPTGDPSYGRQAGTWAYGCWPYPNSRAIHGRLRHDGKEVFGKHDGEKINTDFGTMVWRGGYSPAKSRARSTGWLFIDAISGPPAIWDSYDPKKDHLR